MNNKNGIFSLWLKNFLCLVFMQSFQAIFMALIVIVMGKIISGASSKAIEVSKDGLAGGDDSKVYFLCSVMAYAGVTGIIKLQKLVKGIFGIEDSPLLGDLSKSMKSLMHTAFHAMDIGRDLNNARKAKKSAGIERAAANERLNRIKGNMGSINSLLSSNGNPSNNTTNINMGNGSSNGYSKKDLAALFNDSGNFNENGELISRTPAQQLLYDAQKDQMLAERNYKEAQSKMAVRSLSTIAGLAIASGGSDSIEETISVGNRVGDALNIAGNAVASKPIDAAVRKKAASKINQNNAKIKEATSNEIKKSFEAMNDAIVDATQDISNSSIPKNKQEIKNAASNIKQKVSSSIKSVADDWLNTQYTVPEDVRVSNKQIKPTIEHARKARDNRHSNK